MLLFGKLARLVFHDEQRRPASSCLASGRCILQLGGVGQRKGQQLRLDPMMSVREWKWERRRKGRRHERLQRDCKGTTLQSSRRLDEVLKDVQSLQRTCSRCFKIPNRGNPKLIYRTTKVHYKTNLTEKIQRDKSRDSSARGITSGTEW